MVKDQYIIDRIYRCKSREELSIIQELSGLHVILFKRLYEPELTKLKERTGSMSKEKTIKRVRYNWSEYDEIIKYYIDKGLTAVEIADRINIPYSAVFQHIKTKLKEI